MASKLVQNLCGGYLQLRDKSVGEATGDIYIYKDREERHKWVI